MSKDFHRPIRHIDVVKVKDTRGHVADRAKAIRLYCEQHAVRWVLQLRAPVTLASGREGKDFLATTALLGREDLLALRAVIDAELAGDDWPGYATDGCPHEGCGYQGSEAEVDDHRTTHVHDDEPQAGSNRRIR